MDVQALYEALSSRRETLRALAIKIGAGAIKREDLQIAPEMIGKELELIDAYLYQLDVQKAYQERVMTENAQSGDTETRSI